MIISRTPVRLSFFGGGTDYPIYYRQHGGATLSTTINRYTVITVHKLTQFADHKLRVHYSQVESVSQLDEIRHPSARECLRFLGIEGGVEIHYVSDLPARTGLGSSSSATVGLLAALHAFKGEMVSRDQLAAEAVHVEQNLIRERVGSQDQYGCALGGLLHLEFQRDGAIRSQPVILAPQRLQQFQDHVKLFYTGIQRNAHEILAEQIADMEAGNHQPELGAMKALVPRAIDILTGSGDLAAFGDLWHESWTLKRKLSTKISSSWIDSLYDRARQAGARGGKLLGAGGGGFLALFVEPDKYAAVRQAVPELRETEFALENTGAQIIFYRP